MLYLWLKKLLDPGSWRDGPAVKGSTVLVENPVWFPEPYISWLTTICDSRSRESDTKQRHADT